LRTKIKKAVNYLDRYNIKFRNLSDGVHYFVYEVDDKFLQHFATEEFGLQKGKLIVNIEMTKKTDILVLIINIVGTIEVQCDRCLELFNYPVDSSDTLYIKFGEECSDITDIDNMLILAYNSSEIALAQHIYEYLHLSLPYNFIHLDDENGNIGCNPEMVQLIDSYSVREPETEENDPRWNKLKELYN